MPRALASAALSAKKPSGKAVSTALLAAAWGGGAGAGLLKGELAAIACFCTCRFEGKERWEFLKGGVNRMERASFGENPAMTCTKGFVSGAWHLFCMLRSKCLKALLELAFVYPGPGRTLAGCSKKSSGSPPLLAAGTAGGAGCCCCCCLGTDAFACKFKDFNQRREGEARVQIDPAAHLSGCSRLLLLLLRLSSSLRPESFNLRSALRGQQCSITQCWKRCEHICSCTAKEILVEHAYQSTASSSLLLCSPELRF